MVHVQHLHNNRRVLIDLKDNRQRKHNRQKLYDLVLFDVFLANIYVQCRVFHVPKRKKVINYNLNHEKTHIKALPLIH